MQHQNKLLITAPLLMMNYFFISLLTNGLLLKTFHILR